jgi:putative transposase
MPNYRRALVPGGCFFFTVNLLERRQTLLVDQIAGLRKAVATTRQDHCFTIDACVVLPDHLHASGRCPRRQRLLEARGERSIWQRRFWEHLIRDEADYARHVEYCYINPVKHRWVTRVRDWPYSSFHRDVRAGLFPIDWSGDAETIGEFGER